MGYTCTSCGRYHDEEIRDVRAGLPEEIHRMREDERNRRLALSPSGDFATLADADRHFVRALIEIPIHEEHDVFGWGVWVRLEREAVERVAEAWTDEAAVGSEYPGWLATELRAYGATEGLDGTLRLRSVDLLPSFELADAEHGLGLEQHAGIDLARARELAEPYQQAQVGSAALAGQVLALLPLRPRAGVEAAVAAGEVQAVERDARRHARAAVGDELAGRQLRHRLVPRRVQRARDAAGNAVDRVRLAAPA